MAVAILKELSTIALEKCHYCCNLWLVVKSSLAEYSQAGEMSQVPSFFRLPKHLGESFLVISIS